MEKKLELVNAIKKYKEGDINGAINKFHILIKKYPRDKDILYNYGIILGEIEEYEKEQKIYKTILKIDPSDVSTMVNLSVSLNSTKDFSEAIFYANKAINLNKQIYQAYEARGIAKISIAEIDTGIEDLKKWVELILINNKTENIKSVLKDCIDLINIPAVYVNNMEVENVRIKIENKLEQVLKKLSLLKEKDLAQDNIGKEIAFKLNFFYLGYQQKNDRKINEKYNTILTKLLNSDDRKIFYKNNGKKKLGIISTFQVHPKLFIFDQINEISLYKYDIEIIIINNKSLDIKSLPSYKHQHLRLSAKNYDGIIEYLKLKNYDVAFFPDIGVSITSRILSANRLAKVSLTSWLHPVTSGSKCIDIFLSGQLMEGSNPQDSYSEKLVTLPGIGLYINPLDYISTSINEIECREKSKKFRIGILQTPFKIHPRMDALLIQLAKKIPNSEFIFIGLQKELDEKLINRIRTSFKLANIDNRKVHLIKRMKKGEYDNFLKSIDIAIDTLGWSGGNTALDAFGAALPVLTVEGDQMRANHTAGLYKLINLENFISSNEMKLVERAVILYENYNYLIDQKKLLLSKFSSLKTEKYFSVFFNTLLDA